MCDKPNEKPMGWFRKTLVELVTGSVVVYTRREGEKEYVTLNYKRPDIDWTYIHHV